MIIKLEQPLVINSKYYIKILEILNNAGGECRLVGGCVRDALIGRTSTDIDITTTLLPEIIIKILHQNHIKALLVGVAFGTVSALIERETFEITTLRKDIEYDGRRAKVEFTNNFELDAARRDFTINALSYCPLKQELYDYFNGVEDLKNQKVIFIGEAYLRIQEDYLRILRFFRFSCYYSNQLDAKGLQACVKFKEHIKILSQERINLEINKILLAESTNILKIMFESKILELLVATDLKNINYLEQALNYAKYFFVNLPLEARYALLYWHNNIKISNFIKNKFSKERATKIVNIINFLNIINIGNQQLIIRKIWYTKSDYIIYLICLLSIKKLDSQFILDFINNYQYLEKPLFPLNGNDLKYKGLEGSMIGNELELLKNRWIMSDFMLTKKQLLTNS